MMMTPLKLTKGCLETMKLMNDPRWSTIGQYYDSWVAQIMIPMDVWNSNPKMMAEAMELMKFGKVFDRDGNELEDYSWVMDIVRDYGHEDADENVYWLVCIRDVENWS